MNLPSLEGRGGWESVRGSHRLRGGDARTSYYAPDYGAPTKPRSRYGEPKHVNARQRCFNGGPRVSTEPLRRLLAPIVAELGQPTVAALAGIPPRSLYRVLVEKALCTAELADRLITDVLDDPSVWWTEPGLELRNQKGELLAAGS